MEQFQSIQYHSRYIFSWNYKAEETRNVIHIQNNIDREGGIILKSNIVTVAVKLSGH